MQTRQAHCVCNSLQIETTGEPAAVVMCHCLDCQRRTGSAFGLGAYFSPDQVKIKGASQTFARPTDSSEHFVASFCPTCGTSVFWQMDPFDGRIGIAVGAFADPQFPAPVRSVWEQSKHRWVDTSEIEIHFEKGRAP